MNIITDSQIRQTFSSGQQNVEDLIAPLIELSKESETLFVGHGVAQAGVREEMIPYFHVCGERGQEPPVHALIVGGWVGTETVTPLAVARLIAALEGRLQLAEGLEITAYPVANLESHRANVFLAEGNGLLDARCWDDSTLSHVLVLEKELRRYDYDIVILLRQNTRSIACEVEAWLSTDEQKTVIGDALARCGASFENFTSRINPTRPIYTRTFTRVPDTDRQPAEIIVALPAGIDADQQSSAALGIILSLLHATREARQEGLV